MRTAKLAILVCLLSVPARAEKATIAGPELVEEGEKVKFLDHLRIGKAHYEDDQLKRALVEFEEAWLIQKKPVVAYFLARTHHKLGNTYQAISFYRQFLKNNGDADADRVASCRSNLQELEKIAGKERFEFVDPFSKEQQVSVEIRRRRGVESSTTSNGGRELVVVGSIIGGASWLGALILGASGLVQTSSLPSWATSRTPVAVPGFPSAQLGNVRDGSVALMFPLAGPFAAASFLPDAQWAAPIIILSGGMQIAGLAMTIAGSVRMGRRPVAPIVPSGAAQE